MGKNALCAIEKALEITKYVATGNSFIIIDIRKDQFPLDHISKVCKQHQCDGIILLESSLEADFKMNYYNSDGSLGEMCGNGGRAITLFASHVGIIPRENNCYQFTATNGSYGARIGADDIVTLQMTELYDENRYDLTAFGFFRSFYLNTGVPHAVFEVEDLEQFDVVGVGSKIAHHEMFPNGTNVNFYQISGERRLKIRTFERGVEDETLSCGTGATAAAIAVSKIMKWDHSVELETRGGKLEVSFERNYQSVFLCGKVEKIFSKQLHLS